MNTRLAHWKSLLKQSAVILMVFLRASIGAAEAQPFATRPNILLILADDLGFSDLGCFGGEIQTPHLDRLAADGLRLTQFYNTGRCCPSRASILTGQYPHRVGLGHMTQDIGHPGYRGRVSDRAATIAEVLKGAGYRSFISGKWHLGTDDPTQHGFEEFYGTLRSAGTFWDPQRYLRLPADRKARPYAQGQFYGTDALTDHALDFMTLARATPDRPWFLYLAYNAPHFPLQAPKALIDKYQDVYRQGWDKIREKRLGRLKSLGIIPADTKLSPRSRWWNYGETESGVNPAWESLPADRRADLARRMAIYAAMIERIDTNIGRLLEDLERHDDVRNTLILFLSDNGACAEWDPRGFDNRSSNQNILHRQDRLDTMGGPDTYHSLGSGWANASNTPWRLYKHFCHEGGISTPLIVHWPDVMTRRGAIESTPGHIIDLLPTFVEVAGADYPTRLGNRDILPLQGQSLIPVFSGAAKGPRALYFEHESHRAVREGDFKLVALKDQPWKLFNMRNDRIEGIDLSLRFPQRVQKMSQLWDTWAAENQVTPLPDNYEVRYLKPRVQRAP